jgi:phage gp29-like protein
MNKFVRIGEAAKELGVSRQKLRNLEKDGKISCTRSNSGHRLFDLNVIKAAMGYGPTNGPQPNPFTNPQLTPSDAVNPLTQPSIPAGGQVTVPSIQQLVALLQAGRRYYFQSDQAVRDSQMNAQIMERNLSIQEPLQARMLSACQMPLTVVPDDSKDFMKVRIANELQKIIEEIPNLFKYKWALMQAIWYGRAAVQNIYEWDKSGDIRRLCIKDWIPIHGDNLVFKFDSPAVGLRVGVSSYNQPGTKELYVEPADFSRVHPLTEIEREAHVIHTHLLLAGTFLDPYTGGNVKGTGIRNVIYWTWYLENQCLGMLTEYMERMGLGFTVIEFEAGNQQAYDMAQVIAQAQSFQNIITWPKYPGQTSAEKTNNIYRIEPTLVGVQNFMTLIRDYWDAQMRTYIVGQDSTSQKVSTGLGSEIAAVQENTFFRLVKMDAENLGETLTRELLWIICKYTFPGMRYKCFKVKINTEKPDKKEYMTAVKDFIQVGGTIVEHEAREVLGFTVPTEDDHVLGGKPEDNKVLGTHMDVDSTGEPESEMENPNIKSKQDNR